MADKMNTTDLHLRYLKPRSLSKIFKFCEQLSQIYQDSCMGPLLGPLQLASLNEYSILVVDALTELALTIDKVLALTEFVDTHEHVKKAIIDKATGVLRDLNTKVGWMDGTLNSDKRVSDLVAETVHHITEGLYPKFTQEDD